MSRNPYEPPKATTPGRESEGTRGDTPHVDELLSSPDQVAISTFLGGPLAAGWLAMSNYNAISLSDEGRSVFSWSFVAVLALVTLGFMLPLGFPRIALPIACAFTARYLVEQRFGNIVKEHRGAGGDLMSWWKVVGVALMSAAVTYVIFYLVGNILEEFGVYA